MATHDEHEKLPLPNYCIVKFDDLPSDTRTDIIDVVSACFDRFPNDLVAACKAVKETMERQYNAGWQVVAGESFSFDVSHDPGNCLYLYYNGFLGVLVWKCA